MDFTEVLTAIIHRLTNFVFSLQLWDVLDILVIAYLILLLPISILAAVLERRLRYAGFGN